MTEEQLHITPAGFILVKRLIATNQRNLDGILYVKFKLLR